MAASVSTEDFKILRSNVTDLREAFDKARKALQSTKTDVVDPTGMENMKKDINEQITMWEAWFKTAEEFCAGVEETAKKKEEVAKATGAI